MDERALKRKRELHGDDEESIDMEGKERPREGLKDAKTPKKRKSNDAEVEHDAAGDNTKAEDAQNPDDRLKKLQKRKERRERKKEKAAEQKTKDKEKKKRRKAAHKAAAKESAETKQDPAADEAPVDIPQDPMITTLEPEQNINLTIRASPSSSNSPLAESTFSEPQPASSKSSPPPLDGELSDIKLDAAPASRTTITPTKLTTTTTTLTSSTITINGIASKTNGVTATTNGITSTTIEIATPPPPKPDHATLQARLQAKIDALRAARKADGPDGTPARSRAELIEARRLKQEARRARRLEMQSRQRAAGEEDRPETPLSDEERQRLKAEAQLATLRGTESPLFAPAQKARVGAAGLLFGRVGFGGASPDGDAADEAAGADGADDGGDDASKALLGDALGLRVHAPRKHKGPVDPKSALRAAEARARPGSRA